MTSIYHYYRPHNLMTRFKNENVFHYYCHLISSVILLHTPSSRLITWINVSYQQKRKINKPKIACESEATYSHAKFVGPLSLVYKINNDLDCVARSLALIGIKITGTALIAFCCSRCCLPSFHFIIIFSSSSSFFSPFYKLSAVCHQVHVALRFANTFTHNKTGPVRTKKCIRWVSHSLYRTSMTSEMIIVLMCRQTLE